MSERQDRDGEPHGRSTRSSGVFSPTSVGRGAAVSEPDELGFDLEESTQTEATPLAVAAAPKPVGGPAAEDPFAAALDAALAGLNGPGDSPATPEVPASTSLAMPQAAVALTGTRPAAPPTRERPPSGGMLGGLDAALADAMAEAMAAVSGEPSAASGRAPQDSGSAQGDRGGTALGALAAQGVVLRRPEPTAAVPPEPATAADAPAPALSNDESAPSGDDTGFDSLFEDGAAWSSPTSSSTPSAASSSPSAPEPAPPVAPEAAATYGDPTPARSDEDAALADARAAQEAAEAEAQEALAAWPPLLAALNRLLQTVAAPRADALVMRSAAQAVERCVQACLEDAQRPVELAFLGGAWWLDGQWLPVAATLRGQTTVLTAALKRSQRVGFALSRAANTETLVSAAQAMVAAAKGDASALDAHAGDGLRWTDGAGTRPDVEVWASDVVGRCVELADRAQQSGPFPEDEAIDRLDELSQALSAQPGAVFRAIELRTGAWTTPWSAVATAATALQLCHSARVAPRTAHALALAVLRATTAPAKSGPTPDTSAAAALALAKAAPPKDTWRPASTLAQGLLVQLATAVESPPSGLLAFLHDAHRARLSGRSQWLDALEAAGGPWLTPTLLTVGPLPVGTAVALGDTHVGVVVDLPGEAPPLRPLVQVGQRVVRPNADVRPLPVSP